MRLFDTNCIHPLTHVNTKCKLLVLISNIQDVAHWIEWNKLNECQNALTCGRPDGGGDSGRHWGDAVIVLGVAGLDGSQVAVTPGSEAAGQVQGLHGLGFDLTEHRLAHWLKLTIYFCFTHLWETNTVSMLPPLLKQVTLFLCLSGEINCEVVKTSE